MSACVCGSVRMMRVSGKTSDMCLVEYDGHKSDGYVPYNLGIGGGDYISFRFCLDCGRLRGDFPIQDEAVMENLHG